MLVEKLSSPQGGFFLFVVPPSGTRPLLDSGRSTVSHLASRLALLVGAGGLVLLVMAGPGDSFRSLLGVLGLVGAGLLVGLGKVLRVLGYVEEGAADARDSG